MEFLAFLLSLGALIWAFKNHIAYGDLEEEQRLLKREFARLQRELTKAAPVPEVTTTPSPAQPKEPIPEKPPVIVSPPRQEEPQPSKPSMFPKPPEQPVVTSRAPQVSKPAF